MMTKKSPQLRFEGFTDDWEQRKLTDITSSYSGLTYSPTDVQDKGTFVLRSSNVKNDQLIDADNVYVNPDIVNSNNVKVGDVIVVVRNGSRSLIGKHAIVTKEMPHTVIGAFMSAFRGENGDYINALLSTNNFQKEVHKSLGATINQITGKDFSMMNFQTPKLEEQNKIGSFFKHLDDTIALYQRKLDLLKEQKKGFLQKMFPKNGSKVPELRFAGFADDWEERKLGDVTTWTKGQGLTKEDLNKERDGSEAVHYADLYKFSPVMHEVIHWTNSDDGQIIPDNSLLFPASDVTPVGLARTSTLRLSGVKAGGDVIIGQLDESINSSFMSYQINANSKKILPLITGTTVKHIQAKSLATVSVSITNMAEQTAIAGIFEQLDETIALHQRKLDLLKEQKKGFLQKMFV